MSEINNDGVEAINNRDTESVFQSSQRANVPRLTKREKNAVSELRHSVYGPLYNDIPDRDVLLTTFDGKEILDFLATKTTSELSAMKGLASTSGYFAFSLTDI